MNRKWSKNQWFDIERSKLDIEKLRHVVPHLLPGFDAMVEENHPYAARVLVTRHATKRKPRPALDLTGREAQFALKYFLLRKADRGWHRTLLGAWSA